MTLKDNKVASVLLNICNRSNDLDFIMYGAWLVANGAVPLEYPNEPQESNTGCPPALAERLRALHESIAGHQGPITD